MKVTGQILRENRERRNISVNEVAIATKINVKTIVAMEAGDVAHLPPKTFLRGFVKAYATYLELEVDTILNTFFDEMGSTKPKPPEAVATQPRGDSGEADRAINPKTSTVVRMGAVGGILLLVVLIGFVKNKMENYEKESIPATPLTGIEALSPTPSGSATPATALAVGPSASPTSSPTAAAVVATVTAASPPAPVAAPVASTPAVLSNVSDTAKPTPVEAASKPSPPSPTAQPTATAKPTPSPTPATTPVATATATPKPKSTPNVNSQGAAAAATESPSPSPTPASKMKTSEILIEALNDVSISATIDGEAKTISLSAGAVQSIRAKKVTLNLSDAGAVNLTVNGNDRGVPGDLGKPKRVTLP